MTLHAFTGMGFSDISSRVVPLLAHSATRRISKALVSRGSDSSETRLFFGCFHGEGTALLGTPLSFTITCFLLINRCCLKNGLLSWGFNEETIRSDVDITKNYVIVFRLMKRRPGCCITVTGQGYFQSLTNTDL
ncbi:MAG: hypothetical protein A2170_07230 [Deltaproteobacteria bacterium RBG_13_53_10]|nr:MAG: hypothetical protein A2170_07230 [Deltaproteobacteria bacterium RBG_13_53_10]